MRRRGIFRYLAAERRLSLGPSMSHLFPRQRGWACRGVQGVQPPNLVTCSPLLRNYGRTGRSPLGGLFDVPRFSFRGSGRELARSQVRIISRIIYSAFSDYSHVKVDVHLWMAGPGAEMIHRLDSLSTYYMRLHNAQAYLLCTQVR